MAANSLNAGASSFTPGDAPPPADMEDSFVAYADMMDTIEAELGADVPNGPSSADNNSSDNGAPSTQRSTTDQGRGGAPALPKHMVKHAAEFWFPECRDCTCCNGFKHGCSCNSTRSVCKCSPETEGVVATNGGGGGATCQPAGPRGGKKAAPPCKFFLAGNCRFGEQCRFSHVS